MKKYYKFTIVALFFLVIAVFLFLFSHKSALAPESFGDYKIEEIKIGGKIIKVEIADTPEKQAKGLSGRKFFAENYGMLFVFTAPDYYSFWMKDMNLSLDFIWIRGNEITEITKNVQPEGVQPQRILISKNKIDKVLEVNAGMADRLGMREGDKIEF